MDKTHTPDKVQYFFSHIRKNLLLFLPNADLQQQVQTELRAQISHFVTCDKVKTALFRLRTNASRQFLFEDCTSSQPLLAEISSWPGHVRRFTFLVLLGQQGPSLDSRLAFKLGVDAYIHTQNIEQLGLLFEQEQKAFLARNRIWIEEQEVLPIY